ncbi:hypothetical protein Tco_0065740 [Tanacetum coccineum]
MHLWLSAQVMRKHSDSWKDIFKGISRRLINSGMSSNNKLGLGYEIQSNNEVLSYEEEMNFSVFNCSKKDSVGKPLYSRFIKTNDFKGVPHPLSGDYTPTPQEEIDESLYVYGKKGPQEPEPNVSDDRSSEYSTCQSNDSAGSIGTSSDLMISVFSRSKMAREAKFKKQRVFNTGNGVSKPVWTNAFRFFMYSQFVPRSVQINTGRTNINSVRPNINTGRTNVNHVRPRVNTGSSNVNTVRSRQPVPTKTSNNFSPKRPQVNQFNQRRYFSKSHSPVSRPIVRNTTRMTYSHAVKGNWGSAVKTSACYNWRNSNSNCDSGPTFIKICECKGPHGRTKSEKGLGHIEGNKDQLEDFEKFNGGSVTFGGSQKEIFHKFKERRDLDRTFIKRKRLLLLDTSEDNPKILAFRRELEEIALKHLGKVSENTSTSTPSVNTGSESVNTGSFDPDDSPMPELEIFHKFEKEFLMWHLNDARA